MNYTVTATSKTPALIIYLLDVSASMDQDFDGRKRIEAVNDALETVITRMVQRSTKGSAISPRYRVAMFAYSSSVIDLLGGVKTVAELVNMGVPRLPTLDMTDTAAAFAEAEKLLQRELPNMQDCPAPLICHMTDGEFNGADPLPIAERIKQMSVPDGNVLIENIYVRSAGPGLQDATSWPGITSDSQLNESYSKALFNSSSPIPESYLNVMREFHYQLDPDARMFFPVNNSALIELAFMMSSSTPVTDPVNS